MQASLVLSIRAGLVSLAHQAASTVDESCLAQHNLCYKLCVFSAMRCLLNGSQTAVAWLNYSTF